MTNLNLLMAMKKLGLLFKLEYYSMTIQVSPLTKNKTVILKCLNCQNEEESKLISRRHSWEHFEDFEDQTRTDNDAPVNKCLKCGNETQRYTLGLAKHSHRETIHLCLVIDNESFISRCGLLSGEEGIGNIEPIKNIEKGLNPCQKCAREEGVMRGKDKWYTKEDRDLEIYFYRNI